MALAIVRFTTMGTEVYEDEMGPTIGYDNIDTYIAIVPEDFDDSHFDPETTRGCEVLAVVDTIGM